LRLQDVGSNAPGQIQQLMKEFELNSADRERISVDIESG
jgi:hypothetical protein